VSFSTPKYPAVANALLSAAGVETLVWFFPPVPTTNCLGRLGIDRSPRCLAVEALVDVVVPRQHDVGSVAVERAPEGIEAGIVAVRPEENRGWCQ
jgi:hypothetical protein